MLARSRFLVLFLTTTLVVGLAAASYGVGVRPAPVGQDPIKPGQYYTGDFPDPAVLRVGLNYYAHATTSDGLNVPVLTSTDLKHWRANSGTVTNPSGDGLPRTPVWSEGVEKKDGRFRATTWAPTVTRTGPGLYVLAYATEVKGSPGLMCISIATSKVPTGPFVDPTTKPTMCTARGAIDPQVFVAPNGVPWLIWKVDRHPAYLFATQMNKYGTMIPTGSRNYALTGITQPWEGNIIENPAMIRFKNRYYLFYSANSYASTRYAISYLICKTPFSGCVKPRKTPLMASMKYLSGPGGGTPFVDSLGRLRLAYHAWRAGAVGYPSSSTKCAGTALGCPQRRLYIATLQVLGNGTLKVVRWS